MFGFSTFEKSIFDKLIESHEKTIKTLEDKIQLLEEKLNHIGK